MIVEDRLPHSVLNQEHSSPSDLKTLEDQLRTLVDQARKLNPTDAQYFLQKNGANDLADQIRKLRQEKKETEPHFNEYSLPVKDIYPLKARGEIIQRLNKAETAVADLEQAVQQTAKQVKDFIELGQQNEAKLAQAVVEIRQQSNASELAKFNRLLTQLALIEKQIAQGNDIAPQIEKLIASLDSKELAEQQQYYLPNQQERQEFGRAISLKQLLKRVFVSRESYYQRQKQKYQERTTKKYHSLLGQLPSQLLHPLRDLYVETYRRSSLEEVTTPKEQLATHQDNWQEYLEKSKKIEQNIQLLSALEAWTNTNQQNLSEVTPSSYGDENLFTLLTKEIESIRATIENSRSQLKVFRNQLSHEIDSVIAKLAVASESDMEVLSKQFISFENVAGLYEAHGSYIPLEAVSLRDRALKAYTQISDLVTQSGSPEGGYVTYRLEAMKKEIDNLSLRINAASKFNEEQPQKQDTLWHAGAYDALINKVLRSGHLASRKSQLDLFGEASFSTAGVVSMTKDAVTIIDQGQPVEISWDKYRELTSRNGLAKDLDQEEFQIAFSKNGYDKRYFKGMALVFSEASLRSKSQFMESDGFHFFDKGYTTRRQDSPGFDIDFDKEPFVIAVTAEKAADLQSRIISLLAETKGMSQEQAEQWLKDHVVVIQPNSSIEDTNRKTYSLMEKQGLQKVETGYLVPTGESGENATRRFKQLFAYKSVAELEKG